MNDKDFIKVLRKHKEKISVPDSLKPENLDKLLENADDNVVSMDVKKASRRKISKAKKILLVAASIAAVLVLYVGVSNFIHAQRLKVEYFTEIKDGFTVLKSYDRLSGYLVATKKEAARYKMSDFWEDFKNGELFSNKKGASNKNSETVTLAASSDSYSQTNVRTEGVDEPDVVKTNGEYIYGMNQSTLFVYKPDGENTSQVAQIDIEGKCEMKKAYEMFLKDNKIVIIGKKGNKTMLAIFEHDGYFVDLVDSFTIDGEYSEARMKGDYVYLCTRYDFSEYDVESLSVEIGGETIDCSKVYIVDNDSYKEYCTISSYYIGDECKVVDYASIINDGSLESYVSENYYYMLSQKYDDDRDKVITEILKFSYKNGIVEPMVINEVEGYINDVFCIDEYNGYLRMVVSGVGGSNSLYVLDENLKCCGSIDEIAPGERVYSARFQGDIGYFVTFKRVDPLFSVDLSDPTNPKLIGELKIPGFSEYMHMWGEGKMFGFGYEDASLKLSMFDISDPTNVTQENKYVVKDFIYSEALYNHKALLISPERNIIGFGAEWDDYEGKYDWMYGYCIFSYENGRFVKKAIIPMDADESLYNGDCRGVYIDEYIYVIASSGDLVVVSMEDFENITYITVNK